MWWRISGGLSLFRHNYTVWVAHGHNASCQRQTNLAEKKIPGCHRGHHHKVMGKQNHVLLQTNSKVWVGGSFFILRLWQNPYDEQHMLYPLSCEHCSSAAALHRPGLWFSTQHVPAGIMPAMPVPPSTLLHGAQAQAKV